MFLSIILQSKFKFFKLNVSVTNEYKEKITFSFKGSHLHTAFLNNQKICESHMTKCTYSKANSQLKSACMFMHTDQSACMFKHPGQSPLDPQAVHA